MLFKTLKAQKSRHFWHFKVLYINSENIVIDLRFRIPQEQKRELHVPLEYGWCGIEGIVCCCINVHFAEIIF